jgi:autotransporter-associated beta strand protein
MKPTRLNRFSVLTSSASSLPSAGQSRQGRLRRLASIPSLVLFLAGAQSAHAADFNWDPTSSGTNAGSGSGTWNSADTNWFSGTNKAWATGNRPVFGGVDGPFVVTVADNFSINGLLFNKSGYTLSAVSAQTITKTAGDITLASGVAATIGSNVSITRSSNDIITGTGGILNIGGADQLSTGAQYVNTQSGSTGTRTLSITNGTIVNVNSGGHFGQSPETAYVTATNPNGTSIVIGSATGGSLVVKTGGTVTNGNNQALILGGASASGTLTIDGGQVSAGAVTVGTTGVLPASSAYAGLRFGAGTLNASGTRTASLNGGTLTVGQIFTGTAAASPTFTNTFNFNGGTLQASIANTTFMTGLTTANVQAGGAKIDTNGFDITMGQALIHDATLGATLDGGLTKSSAGVLTLTASNTYTGDTTISGGTLQISSGSGRLNAGNYAGAMSIAPSATFESAITGSQTLSGAITGGGTLKNVGGGALILSNGSNSYGALSISAVNSRVFINTNATALPAAATVEITSGALVFAAPATRDNAITVSSGGVLSARATTTLNNVTLPGTGSVIFNSDDANTSLLTISNGQTLTGDLTVQVGGSRMGTATTALGAVTLSGNLTGGGGLVVASSGNFANNPTLFGTGVITLSGNNNYTGDTTVNSGVLAVTGTAIPDTGKLVINDPGKVDLTNTESVNTLFFGAVQQPSGSYSASSVPAGATITTASFSGSGTLTVGAAVDTTPPVWIANYPKVGSVTSTSFNALAETDENGNAYFVVIADGATAPTSAQVKLGQDSTSGAALKSGSMALTANVESSSTVTGLTSSTNYDVYFVADDVPNLQLTPFKVDVLTLSAYADWAAGFPGFTPTTPTLDFENDGIQNLLEFVLGGNPTTNDSLSIGPSVSTSGTDLVMTFNRTDLSEDQPVTVKVQTSADLVNWTNFATIGAVSGSGYTVAENGVAADTIIVTIPKAAAIRKFARVTAE